MTLVIAALLLLIAALLLLHFLAATVAIRRWWSGAARLRRGSSSLGGGGGRTQWLRRRAETVAAHEVTSTHAVPEETQLEGVRSSHDDGGASSSCDELRPELRLGVGGSDSPSHCMDELKPK